MAKVTYTGEQPVFISGFGVFHPGRSYDVSDNEAAQLTMDTRFEVEKPKAKPVAKKTVDTLPIEEGE